MNPTRCCRVCICAAAGKAAYKGEYRASFWTDDRLYPLGIISGRHSDESQVKLKEKMPHCFSTVYSLRDQTVLL